MNAVIIMIVLAAILFSRRLYQIYRYFSSQQGNGEITLQLPVQFYFKQGVGLLVVAIFLISLNPVPAGIAIAAAFGLYFNLFISIIWHSISAQRKADKHISA